MAHGLAHISPGPTPVLSDLFQKGVCIFHERFFFFFLTIRKEKLYFYLMAAAETI